MERPVFSLAELKNTSGAQYAGRFVFGGMVAALAALITRQGGPVAGGLFLAFPAMLPASLTLVNERDGRKCAYDDARGACLGSIGLAVFAAVVWSLATARVHASVPLLAALVAWMLTSGGLWWVALRREGASKR